ncbi:hypothetical protein BH09MYX1_BH09MYX1_09230 [soil metagenome]
MRARNIVIPVIGLSLCSAAFMFACGGTEDTPPVVDAGKDGTTIVDAAPDTAAEAAVEAGCATDASLTSLVPPDAAIGDSGATLPGCAACLKTKCASDINDCDKLCECKDAVIGVYDCLGKNKGFQQCAVANFVGAGQETQTIGFSLGTCAQASCNTECGVSSFIQDAGTGDAGPKDAGGQ